MKTIYDRPTREEGDCTAPDMIAAGYYVTVAWRPLYCSPDGEWYEVVSTKPDLRKHGPCVVYIDCVCMMKPRAPAPGFVGLRSANPHLLLRLIRARYRPWYAGLVGWPPAADRGPYRYLLSSSQIDRLVAEFGALGETLTAVQHITGDPYAAYLEPFVIPAAPRGDGINGADDADDAEGGWIGRGVGALPRDPIAVLSCRALAGNEAVLMAGLIAAERWMRIARRERGHIGGCSGYGGRNRHGLCHELYESYARGGRAICWKRFAGVAWMCGCGPEWFGDPPLNYFTSLLGMITDTQYYDLVFGR